MLPMALLLADAAEITLRRALTDPAGEVGMGRRDRLANTLADRPAEHRQQVCETVSHYRDDLDGVGFSDAEIGEALGAGRFTRSFLFQLLIP